MSTVTSPNAPAEDSATPPAVVVSNVGLPSTLDPQFLVSLTAQATQGSGVAVTMHAPFNGAPLCPLPQCTAEDVHAAADRARAAQRVWAETPMDQRSAIMLRFHDLVAAHADTIMDLIQAENGKARRDAFLEVGDVLNTARYYARIAKPALKNQARKGLIPGLTAVTEIRQPRGIVAVISPWNYPFTLGVGDTIPALLAGNAVVQKPDNQTALTALFALSLARKAGLPEDLWQIVLGRGSHIGDPLLDIADYVMFTGSTASGRRIAAQAGERLVDCSLELGGKNAMIVLDDADLGRTVEGAVRACFSSSGQLCISIERMYVLSGIYDEFVPRFVEAVTAMPIGADYGFAHQMGSLTSADQLATVTRHVEDAVSKGARVLAGGVARPDLGPFFFEPTVLADVEPGMVCFDEETFGPLVSIYKVGTAEEAVSLANDTEYGLNASVWSRSASQGEAVAAKLHSGTVNVNEAYAAAWGSVDAPMGGMGASGLGRRHGVVGITKYTESQTIARQRLMNLAPPIESLGDSGFAKVMLGALRAMKAIGWK